MSSDHINLRQLIGMLRSETAITIGDCNNFSKSLRWIQMENISSDRDSWGYRINTRPKSRYPNIRAELDKDAYCTMNLTRR
jgi:hypothetical protein